MAKMLEDAGIVSYFAFATCVDVVVDRVAERLFDSIRSIRLVFAQPLDVVHQAVENAPLGIVLRGRFDALRDCNQRSARYALRLECALAVK